MRIAPWMKRWIVGDLTLVRFFGSLGVLYCFVLLLLVLFSERLIFLPPSPSYGDGPSVLELTDRDGTHIAATFLPQDHPSLTILFSHGNAEDLGQVRPVLSHLHRLGFSVFAYDYRGYGASQGEPSESGAYQDIDAAYDYLTTTLHVPPERIIAYGRSLGGGPSVDLASRKKLGGLVLESTFVSAFRVVTRWPLFPFDRFKNAATLARVRCPVLVMHGTADSVIPFWHGVALAGAANEPKRFWKVDGADHMRVMGRPGYDATLRSFAELVAPP